MTEARQHGKLGRGRPHPVETHPRVFLDDYMAFSALPTAPPTVDRLTKVPNWPMYMNDQLGDCVEACVGHQIQAVTSYASTEVTVPDSAVLKLYEDAAGYVPGDPSTDNGTVIQDALQVWHDSGVQGHTIAAFAELSNLSWPKLKQCLYLFGTVHLGINCPQSALDQFDMGSPVWSYQAGSPIAGGHAIPLQKVTPYTGVKGILSVVTWGESIRMTTKFASEYIEEAWVVLTHDWVAQNGNDIDGFSYSQLQADFNAING